MNGYFCRYCVVNSIRGEYTCTRMRKCICTRCTGSPVGVFPIRALYARGGCVRGKTRKIHLFSGVWTSTVARSYVCTYILYVHTYVCTRISFSSSVGCAHSRSSLVVFRFSDGKALLDASLTIYEYAFTLSQSQKQNGSQNGTLYFHHKQHETRHTLLAEHYLTVLTSCSI